MDNATCNISVNVAEHFKPPTIETESITTVETDKAYRKLI